MRSRIPEYLAICGIPKESPDYGLQFSLMLAAISTRSLRAGCAPKVKDFLILMDAVDYRKPVVQESRFMRFVFGVIGMASSLFKKRESFQDLA